MIDIEVKHPSLYFTKDEVQRILENYNRTLENVQKDIDIIKQWIKSQPHLTHMPEDRLIFSLLIRNKFSFEKTKQKLDNYYSIRTLIPEAFVNRLPSQKDIKEIRKISRCFTLPKLVNLNRVIFFVHDEMHHKFDAYTKLAKTFMDIEGLFYRDIHSSVDLIWDGTNGTLAFWSHFTPVMAKIVVNVAEKVCSNRANAIRLIGLPSFAQVVINSAIGLLPQKFKDRISIHKDPKEMAKFYPEDLLPKEFGGIGKSYREMSKDFDEMIDQCEDYFKHIQNFKVEEKLRPVPLDNDELLGFHGNFRKLDLD